MREMGKGIELFSQEFSLTVTQLLRLDSEVCKSRGERVCVSCVSYVCVCVVCEGVSCVWVCHVCGCVVCRVCVCRVWVCRVCGCFM